MQNVLYINKLITILRHGKVPELWDEPTFRPKNDVISYLYLCVFYPSVSVGRLATRVLFIVLHSGRKETVVFQKVLLNSFCSCFSIANKRISSSFERFCLYLWQNGLWSQNMKMNVFRCDVGSVYSFDLYSD